MRDRFFKVKQKGNTLFFANTTKPFLTQFFRLDDQYDAILKSVEKDAFISDLITKYYGLRLLRQDPWECTVSYLCSMASNIPKIKGNIEKLSASFGKPIFFDNFSSFAFPEPRAINNIHKIKNCSTGFRAKYIHGINKKANDPYFQKIKALPYEQAKEQLKQFPGIADKIADCILLFSCEKPEAFPVDVWMKRIMQEQYLNGQKMNEKQIAAFGRSYFGKNAGYAQQFLYYGGRKKK